MADDIDRDVNVATRANAESAWTFGTMFLHFNNRLDSIEARTMEFRHEMDRRYEQRWEAQQEAIKAALVEQDKALDHAVIVSLTRHNEGNLRHEQRWAAQQEAIRIATTSANDILVDRDKRYDQRWAAQEAAILAALSAQEKGVGAAMESAKEAVLKAELANEKRFACVAADTPILCADLVWRAAGELRVGDELIGLDEEAPTRRGRRFRRAIVTDNNPQQDDLFQVATTAGSVNCNAEHPWLALPPSQAQGAGTHWRWVKTADLCVGDKVMRSTDLWEVDQSWKAGWLAGMYDGEGCLSFAKQTNKSVRNPEGSDTSYLGCHLTVTQREGSTAERLRDILNGLVGSHCIFRRERTAKHQPVYYFIITRRADVLRILGSIRPPRLLIASAGVWDGRPINGNHRETFVTAITAVGKGTIANLATSTKTYIAGGFAMHNSVNEFRGTLSDQAGKLIPRIEVDGRLLAMSEKMSDMSARMDRSDGKGSGMAMLWGIIVAGFGALGVIVTIGMLLIHSH